VLSRTFLSKQKTDTHFHNFPIADEIYSNAIPRGNRFSKSKPSLFKPSNYQRQKPKSNQPYQNVRINNSFRQQRVNSNWPTYTQVIFSPPRADRLIDISTAASQNAPNADKIDRVSSITTAVAPTGKL
jgi:hypothetical protein